MPCNLETIQAAACESGIGKLTNSVPLLQLVAQLLCEISESGGGAAQTPWTQDIDAANFNITNLGTINGKKVYRALLTQTGTNAPVATVLENSLGGTVVWARSMAGTYSATLVGAFTANKTFVVMGAPSFGPGSGAFPSVLYTNITSPDVIDLLFVDSTGAQADSGDISITNTAIEITVYP